jgi:dihydrofolate reductase
MGHTLIMGRKTYDSIGRSLPGRSTIVATRQPDWTADRVTVTQSLGEALAAAAGGQIFIAGGGQIYEQAMPIADRLEVTQVDLRPAGDALFPEISEVAPIKPVDLP